MKANSQIFRLGPSGLEEMHPAPALPIGTKIWAFGYAMSVQYFAIYDENRNAVEIASGDYLDAYFSPLHQCEECILPISKKFGIGFYYDLDAPKYSAEQIAAGLERAKRIEQLKKQRAEERAEAERKAMNAARTNYPYLKEGARGAEVAANMRKELRQLWPSVKFSVRYKSFSGGDEIFVKYEDGPRVEDVEGVANKYQDHGADISCDYWDYTPSAFNKVFGGVSFVQVERNFKPETLADAAEFVARACPTLVKEIHREIFFEKIPLHGEDGDKIYKAIGCAAWIGPASLARWVAALEDYTTPVQCEELAPAVEAAPAPEGLTVVEYSEKCFAIVGNTKEIKDQLKSLGGRFNARLTCGAGWVFPATKRGEILNALKLQ